MVGDKLLCFNYSGSNLSRRRRTYPHGYRETSYPVSLSCVSYSYRKPRKSYAGGYHTSVTLFVNDRQNMAVLKLLRHSTRVPKAEMPITAVLLPRGRASQEQLGRQPRPTRSSRIR